MGSESSDQGEPKSERFNMFISKPEMEAIEEWSWKNRVRSKSEAVRRLVQIGLLADQYLPEISALHLAVGAAAVEAKANVRNNIQEEKLTDDIDVDHLLYLASFIEAGFREIDRDGAIMAEHFFSYVSEINALSGEGSFNSVLAEKDAIRKAADEKLKGWRSNNDALDIINRAMRRAAGEDTE